MNGFLRIALVLAGLLTALPLSTAAGGTDHARPRVRVKDDGDTVEVEAARTRAPFRRSEAHGSIGISLIDITPELRSHFGAPKDAGAMIGEVEKDSPASRAGLEVADIVTSIDGERVSSARELARAVRRRDAGGTVRVELVRDRALRTVQVGVEDRPRREMGSGSGEFRDFGRDMGRMGRELGREIRREMGAQPFQFDFDTHALAVPRRDEIRHLKERVEELEKRLKDLEERRVR